MDIIFVGEVEKHEVLYNDKLPQYWMKDNGEKCVAEYFQAKKIRLETTENEVATTSHESDRYCYNWAWYLNWKN